MTNNTDKHRVLLMILDGWGEGRGDAADLIKAVPTPNLDAVEAAFPHALLRTDGPAVGLPEGQMGNSEVGHTTIGAGRTVDQDLVKINKCAAADDWCILPAVRRLVERSRVDPRPVHLIGLYSPGGVHSLDEHFLSLMSSLENQGVADIRLWLFTDGRDTDPKSALGYVEALEEKVKWHPAVKIAGVIGRYWAMDRDKRFERVRKAYDLLVRGEGERAEKASEAIQRSYEAGVTDEFLEPVAIGSEDLSIRDGDQVVFMNFRNDRAKELTRMLKLEEFPEHGTEPLDVNFYSMTPYDATFSQVEVIFEKEDLNETLGEVVSREGLRQLRIAETEKYPHVTFFFNGGRETPYSNEARILVPSPKVATYDLQPEMSAPEVTRLLNEALAEEHFDFVCLNFANGDMVGHTGKFDAIKKAVATIDRCAGEVIATARAHGYDVVQIADHGNCDHAMNEDGSPNTAHSLNPVPIRVVSERVKSVKNGTLADVAPTVLAMMGIEQPSSMTGEVLVEFK